jgi:peptidoglycan/LPS O-acetylase OafA/YrhL
MNAKTSEFHFLNMLRGVAAIVVVYFHLQIHIFNGYPTYPIRPGTFTYYFVLGDFDLGKYAVGIFFMVSGFLIPSTLIRPNSTLKDYCIHRFFRLYPAYWISIIVWIGLQWFQHPADPLPWRAIATNITMLQKFVGSFDLIGVYWTLQIELIFYFACAMLFVTGLLRRRQAIIWCSLLGALGVAAGRMVLKRELPVAIFIALALMFLGDTIRAYSNGSVEKRELRRSFMSVALMLIPICLLGYAGEGPRYVLTYYAAMGTFWLAYVFRSGFAKHHLIRTVGAFLADCSYSVYLLAGPTGLTLGEMVWLKTGNHFYSIGVSIVVTVACAWVTFMLIEKPCIGIGKRLTRKRVTEVPFPTATATANA